MNTRMDAYLMIVLVSFVPALALAGIIVRVGRLLFRSRSGPRTRWIVDRAALEGGADGRSEVDMNTDTDLQLDEAHASHLIEEVGVASRTRS